ncbi:MAG: hypothetical protein ABIJ59_02180 [Pseudomonadota bacterium]
MATSPYDFTQEADAASQELEDDINRLKPIPEHELKMLLPDRADQEQLKDLIKAVNEETDKNKKMALLTERLGNIAINVKTVAEKIISGAIKLA